MSDSIIKIPTKHIYNKENQKVIDNVIDKLEIGSTVINTEVEKNVTVFSRSGDTSVFTEGHSRTELVTEEASTSTTESNALHNFNNLNGDKAAFDYNLGWLIIKTTYLTFYVDSFADITFPKRDGNNKIVEVETPQFSYTLNKKIGKVSRFTITYGDKGTGTINNKVGNYFNNATISEIVTSYTDESTTEEKLSDVLYYKYTSKGVQKSSDTELELDVGNFDNTLSAYLKTLLYYNTEYYMLDKEIKFLIGVEIITITKNGQYLSSDYNNAFDISKAPSEEIVGSNYVSSSVKYEPENISVSVFGKKMSIKLDSRTIIVGDKDGKKPCAIEGNELMQTSNYYLQNNKKEPSIEFLYNNTKSLYQKGKETATVRCSISDYYDLNGELAVSTKDKNVPMSFNLYDKVIPMVRNGNGYDMPMSLDKDGKAKVFTVLGSKIFYDGAVWEELSLQEDKITVNVLQPPTIAFSENKRLLEISNIDENAENAHILVNGTIRDTISEVGSNASAELSDLSLHNNDKISVRVSASNAIESLPSNILYYSAILDTPIISFSNGYVHIDYLDARTNTIEAFIYDSNMNFISSKVLDMWLDRSFDVRIFDVSSGVTYKIQVVAISNDPQYGNSEPSEFVDVTVREKLSAPTLEEIESPFIMINYIGVRPDSYDVYIDGSYVGTAYGSINMSTYDLITGKYYKVSVKASKYGYDDSDFSNEVDYKAIGEDFPEYDEPPSDRPDYVGTNATNSVTEYVEAEVYLLEKPDLKWLSKILKQIDGGNTLSIGFYDVLGEYHSIITVVEEYVAGQYGLLYDGKLVCLQNEYTNETRWVEGYMYRYLAITPSQPMNTWVIDWFNGNIAQINAYSLKK